MGFTVADGSFVIKARGDVSFQLRQRAEGHIELFKAFTLLFMTNRSVELSKGYLQFTVGSVKDIERVINFFSCSGLHPLVGLKQDNYAL